MANTKTHRIALPALAATLILPTAAHAGPFDPAYRGLPNSVYARFDWNDSSPDWDLTAFNTVGTEYPLDPTLPSGSGGDTDAVFICPNFIDEEPLKLMRLQFWFDGPIDGSLIDIDVLPHDPLGGAVIETDRGGQVGPFSVYYIDIEITPNPDWEEILFFGDLSENIRPGNFLVLEIDTISLPTPSSAAPLALGALAITRRRR